MTRPRAADDFPAIRARMHELRRENITRARSADDFATIRARIDELRREQIVASTGRHALITPRTPDFEGASDGGLQRQAAERQTGRRHGCKE